METKNPLRGHTMAKQDEIPFHELVFPCGTPGQGLRSQGSVEVPSLPEPGGDNALQHHNERPAHPSATSLEYCQLSSQKPWFNLC